MKSLAHLLKRPRSIRVVGFDDAPFDKSLKHGPVNLSGIVCSNTRFEGMLWGCATRDGSDATEVMAGMLLNSKFHRQVHLVIIDGLTIGGFNLVDLPGLAERLDRPCVAVMRRMPNVDGVRKALARFPDAQQRLALVDRAGPIYQDGGFTFQVAGSPPEPVPGVLSKLTDTGLVPEALRLAHLIGGAVKTGESGRRA